MRVHPATLNPNGPAKAGAPNTRLIQDSAGLVSRLQAESPCPHFRSTGHPHGGLCTVAVRTVSHGVCRQCLVSKHEGKHLNVEHRNVELRTLKAGGSKFNVQSSNVQRSAVSALRPFSALHALILRLAAHLPIFQSSASSFLARCSCRSRAARWDAALQSAKFKVQQVLSGGVPKFNVQSRGRGIQRSGILRRALLRLAVLAPWRFPPRSSP